MVYLSTFSQQNPPNVGKYTIHESSGRWKMEIIFSHQRDEKLEGQTITSAEMEKTKKRRLFLDVCFFQLSNEK